MSTRSNIGIQNEDGTITFVYSHWDGFPSHHGPILLEHYNTEALVRELLIHGNISSLAEYCAKPEGHSFATPYEGYTVYYGRDRGEPDQGPKTLQAEDALIAMQASWAEFFYLFRDGCWHFSSVGPNSKLRPLTLADTK